MVCTEKTEVRIKRYLIWALLIQRMVRINVGLKPGPAFYWPVTVSYFLNLTEPLLPYL